MIASSLLLSTIGVFRFVTRPDMISDQPIYDATVDFGRGSYLMMSCGPRDSDRLVVNFKPGKTLRDMKGGLLIPFTNRFRFDQGVPIDIQVSYRNDLILIEGKWAWRFVEMAKGSKQIVVEYSDYSDSVFQHRLTFTGAEAALSAIEKHCSRQ